MELSDLLDRSYPPEPWQDGDNIPWHEPAFSRRMLAEHLSQAHDAASRRSALIDRHVAWIDAALLQHAPTAILDLGCGPGLYASRLARRGHRCVGIDYSPASIDYARGAATAEQLACRYELADLRTAALGAGYGLAMCIFGELNVFPRAQAAALLAKTRAALRDGGLLLLEAHTDSAVERIGRQPPRWFTAAAGLFGDAPHLCLSEHFWHDAARAATTRHYVVALGTGAVARYAQSFQAYTERQYAELLHSCGFVDVAFYPALTGASTPEPEELLVIVARKDSALPTLPATWPHG